MRDAILTIAVLFFTAALIYIIRLLTADRFSGCHRPRARFTVYYDYGCECLEYSLGRIYGSRAIGEYELEVEVVDMICTAESRQWLNELRRKLKKDFIISEGKSDTAAGNGHNQGDS